MKHVFELSGLGKAPFRCTGYYCADGQGTGCAHCGTGIKHVFTIESSDGVVSRVGSTCVNKTGDKGLFDEAKAIKKQAIRNAKHAIAQAAYNAELDAQRDSNGGLTDHGLRMQKAQAIYDAKVEKYEPLADRLEDGKNGFRDSITRDLRNGCLPIGRGLSIMIDILAKQKGRSGSDAYNTESKLLTELLT